MPGKYKTLGHQVMLREHIEVLFLKMGCILVNRCLKVLAVFQIQRRIRYNKFKTNLDQIETIVLTSRTKMVAFLHKRAIKLKWDSNSNFQVIMEEFNPSTFKTH